MQRGWSEYGGFPRMGGGPAPAEAHGWTVLLAVAVLLLSGALVVWQVTAPPTAERLIRAAVAAAVDPAAYVADRGDDLRAMAAEAEVVRPPGFAVPVALTAPEVAGASDDELAHLLLVRAADAVVVHGPKAFDPEGQASYSRFSRAGLLAWFIDVLRDERLHRWAGVAAFALAAATALLAAATAARAAPTRRLALVGWGFVAGTLPGAVFFGAIAFWLGRAGSDPFSRMLASIAADVFEIGRNDCLAILAGGAALVAVNRALVWAAARGGPAAESDLSESTERSSPADFGREGDAVNDP
ncbi:hypothetical protein HRbin29_01257 [bacterium HR29]|nr:hypothetical protein HRbin29_01257 [bacterium HR29]